MGRIIFYLRTNFIREIIRILEKFTKVTVTLHKYFDVHSKLVTGRERLIRTRLI